MAALPIALGQGRVSWRPGLGKDHVDLEAPRPMCVVGLSLLCMPQEALTDSPLDVELIHVPLVLDLTS